jgi:hypothetical protein
MLMYGQEMIEKGLSLVQDDEQHDLRVGFRCRLLSSFDEVGGAGRRRRTRLATVSVEKVLPLWESLFPTDHTPRQALDLAEKVFAETVSAQTAEKEMGLLWTHCDDLVWRHTDKQNTIMVGYGAVQAIRGCSKSGICGKSPRWKGNPIPLISRTNNGLSWNHAWPLPSPAGGPEKPTCGRSSMLSCT